MMHDAKESIKFWSELWGNLVDYNRNAEWRKRLSVSHSKVILTSLRRTLPYILGKCQIAKRSALMDYMNSG